MNLRSKKRIAGSVLKCSIKRVKFDVERLSEIKEAITTSDIKSLINDGAINSVHKKGVSRARANVILAQKKKGRQKGHGSRKGKFNARKEGKRTWINKVRLQRDLIRILKEKEMITNATFSDLYQKIKGGYFRSRRHIKIFLEEHDLIRKG